jgi:hypothetical protein
VALAFDDPYAGPVQNVELGQSKITPRETYSVDRRALNEQYEDKISNSARLFDALSKFTGAVGNAEKDAQQKEIDQAGVLAAQVGGSIKDGENVDLKLGTLLPDHSPLARAAVAEIIGKQRGLADGQSLYENMPLEARNDPTLAQQYFDQKLKESAGQYAGSPFYNNARTSAMRQAFTAASTALSHQRNQQMLETFQQDAKQQTQDKADAIVHDAQQNPDKYDPANFHSWRSEKILNSPIGDRVAAAAKSAGIPPSVLAAIVHIESGGNPNAKTGSYTGLGQLSTSEFKKYGPAGGSILNIDDNLQATANSLADKSRQFTKEFGRPPNPTELYMMHQQGEAGLRSHVHNPDQPAWMSMLQTGEGKQKGENWARAAIWGNIANQDRAKFGSVDNVTSRDFLNYWSTKMGSSGGAGPVTKNAAVASTDPSFVPGSDATTATPAADGSTPAPTQTAQADIQPAGKTVYDYAGRPEKVLPPAVQTLRDELFTVDKMQDFTHPTVDNAQKRDNMVEAVITAATRSGQTDWLKAIPNSVLTPDLRTKLVKVEKQIDSDNYTKAEHARKAQDDARKDASRDWNTQANKWIIENPGSPPPPKMVLDAMDIDPGLLESFNARRDAVIKGLTDPRAEDTKVQALESKILDIAAAGGDPRNVNVNSVLDPAKHQKLLEFQMETRKAGGELSNAFYDKTWTRDAQSLYGFQYGIPVQGGQKSNPEAVDIERDFHKNLAREIAAYTAEKGSSPNNNNDRRDIYDKALAATVHTHKPKNDDGARVSGQGKLPTDDADQASLKRAQEKYQLGRD